MKLNINGKEVNVKRVYNGKAKTCMCGCAGNYSEDPKMIKRTVTKILKAGIKDMNEVYAKFFGDHKPARFAVEVTRLPLDVLIEIDAIAVKE